MIEREIERIIKGKKINKPYQI